MQVLARRVLTFLRSFYSCSQKYKKVWHFLRKTLDICLRFGYNNTRRQGHGPRRKEYADVAELADALDSGSSSLKRVWVQIPSSAPKSSNVCSGIFCFSDLFGMASIVPRTVGADSISARGALPCISNKTKRTVSTPGNGPFLSHFNDSKRIGHRACQNDGGKDRAEPADHKAENPLAAEGPGRPAQPPARSCPRR